MRLHEIGRPFYNCPNCYSKDVKPITAEYANCQYRIHDVKEDGTEFKSNWEKMTRKDAYQRYDPSNQTS